MALLVSDVLLAPQRYINDVAGARWDPTTVLIPYINRGMLEIVKKKPDAYLVRESVKLQAGKCYQKVLPADVIQLVDVVGNTGPDGLTTGRQITKIPSTEQMDRTDRNWQTKVSTGECLNWIFAEPDPQAFYVYPMASPSIPMYVEVLYSMVPPAVSALTDTIPIRSMYRFQLELFVTGNALMVDIPQGDQPRGKAYLDLFFASLGA